ncbi:MAG: tetratricopeptide repeat protein, partial [Planctomycetota bacterium]|nr:tetratricopeptide repeat protein [Planctomycetota bacterium]
EAHNNLGGVLKKIGRVDEAIAQFEQALKIKPEHAQAHYNLALALTQTGKGPEALAHFAQAVRINPDFTPALNNLAWLLATSEEASLRDGAQAVRLAEHACQLDGRKSFGSLDTLAAAYAEAGRFADALAAAQEALALAKGANQPAAAADIQTRLALYRAGKPYREPPPAH